MNLKNYSALFLFTLHCLPFTAHAETIEILSGTGFYVSPDGYVVTNEHVVQNCKSIRLKSKDETVEGVLKAVDKTNDLAIIQAKKAPYYIATLRYEQNLKKDDEVTVIGFPVENGRAYQYRMRTAHILDTKGPSGQEGWLQFSEALKKGNSGGPLLDEFGNVIGVVRGRASFYEITYEQQPDGSQREISRGAEQRSDIAINLPILTRFLQANFVNYGNMLNFQPMTNEQKFEAAQRYIINVQCVQ